MQEREQTPLHSLIGFFAVRGVCSSILRASISTMQFEDFNRESLSIPSHTFSNPALSTLSRHGRRHRGTRIVSSGRKLISMRSRPEKPIRQMYHKTSSDKPKA